MKPIPINYEGEMIDPTTYKPSPFKKGLIVGLVIVVMFWLGVLILGGAMLILH
jgi:hypothetical protein